MLLASPEYGSGTIGMLDSCTTPQPLSVKCASPWSAPMSWPWQVDEESDMMLQPAKFAVGTPLPRIPVPIVFNDSRQYWRAVVPTVATAFAVNVCAGAPPTVVSPLKPM